MSLWWLEPGWSDARCACGARIAPEGDPDWGACFHCFSAQLQASQMEEDHWRSVEARHSTLHDRQDDAGGGEV